MFQGYLNNEKATAKTFNAGYLKTGDTGEIDPESGLFRITGRIKDLIMTAGGENIGPVAIENNIKTLMGAALSNVIVAGGFLFPHSLHLISYHIFQISFTPHSSPKLYSIFYSSVIIMDRGSSIFNHTSVAEDCYR